MKQKIIAVLTNKQKKAIIEDLMKELKTKKYDNKAAYIEKINAVLRQISNSNYLETHDVMPFIEALQKYIVGIKKGKLENIYIDDRY